MRLRRLFPAWCAVAMLAAQTAPVNEPAHALTAQGLDNLVAYARVFGYVRHFYPSNEVAGADWAMFAIEGVRKVEDAKGPEDLAARLTVLFKPVAPEARIFVTGRGGNADAVPPVKKMIRWRHNGFGTGQANTPIVACWSWRTPPKESSRRPFAPTFRAASVARCRSHCLPATHRRNRPWHRCRRPPRTTAPPGSPT